jgi:hypothetical protein
VEVFGNFGLFGQIVQAAPTRDAAVEDKKIGNVMWHKKRKIVTIQNNIITNVIFTYQNIFNCPEK